MFETVLMIVLTCFSYLFLVTFLTFCGSAVKQESGREGLIPHIGGYPPRRSRVDARSWPLGLFCSFWGSRWHFFRSRNFIVFLMAFWSTFWSMLAPFWTHSATFLTIVGHFSQKLRFSRHSMFYNDFGWFLAFEGVRLVFGASFFDLLLHLCCDRFFDPFLCNVGSILASIFEPFWRPKLQKRGGGKNRGVF